MQKQQGFTLIELVVVIIILGILAVTAAPKFINLQADARQSSLQGVKGAIQGANGLVFARAAIDGHEKKAIADWAASEGVDIGAEELAVTNFGYLQADMDEFNNAIDADFGTADAEWIVVATPPTLTITQNGSPTEVVGTSACKLVYTQAADANTVPTYVVTDNGC
ncbi:prepilin-type N-terminal cleavage/methylation domain-containing protein [Shewanella sp. 10N.7]|uniref:type II secretion system protein n=1 Tax=Shewanella sp. 10N.7 TaxID=2885093 RepID=UPI001E417A86|nr:prepilin-type N-terminal cleavage/methylation domain-containing protein [Shewanella sp. 10N.7]MCC4832982.1 prepilin-type N-terminal cleavage/methylation domain-containing protein [Shewanella sp. 10N.7]